MQAGPFGLEKVRPRYSRGKRGLRREGHSGVLPPLPPVGLEGHVG